MFYKLLKISLRLRYRDPDPAFGETRILTPGPADEQGMYLPILSETAAQPRRPARLPADMDIRTADAKEDGTKQANNIQY